MGKKAVEMGRYGASELMRNEKFWKKAIDYTLDKLNPTIQNVGSQALDQLPTKITLNKKKQIGRIWIAQGFPLRANTRQRRVV